jgi:hypothetical protein
MVQILIISYHYIPLPHIRQEKSKHARTFVTGEYSPLWAKKLDDK